jgi:DNA-binding CsgD family transcriptional regulator/PAS domain-containing protein
MAKMDSHEIVRGDAIALIFEAALDPSVRRRALSVVAESLDAAAAIHLVWDKMNERAISCEVAGALKPDFAALYRDRHGVLDPRRKFLESARAESLFVSHYDLDPVEFKATLFHREFFGPQGLEHTLAANLSEIDGEYVQIYVERSAGQPRFSAADIMEFRRLVRHMASAERLSLRVKARVADQVLPKLILDSFSVGTIVTDETGKLEFANAAAEEILRTNDGIQRREQRVQAGRAFETNGLMAHLRDAIEGSDASGNDGGALLVARPSGKRPYAVTVIPLPAPASFLATKSRRRALLFIADLDHRNGDLTTRLGQLFGLSRAEARVAAGIVEGRRLNEIALESGVRMPTVRTQLRAVLRKIGATRQADMVRIVLALPPLASRGGVQKA